MMDRRWLELRTEDALEPDLEIVDGHHHLWDFVSRFGRYELEDLRQDTSGGHNVVSTVFIDCGANYLSDGPEAFRPVGETIYVAGRADESDRTSGAKIAAIVSHVDLTLGAKAGDVLDRHQAEAGGRFRGIRHSGARADDPSVPVSRTEPPADLYHQPAFRVGAAELANRGLTFEAWQYHTQLDAVVDLARAVPELTIIVNHLGGPLGTGAYAGRRDEVHRSLRASLVDLAAEDNVVMKVGGIGMTRFGVGWEANDLPPTSDEVVALWSDTVRYTIDTFGPARCLFESNFPVDGETVSYVTLWNAFKKMSTGYDQSERTDLFSGTARRVYGIG
ncbi:MAG: amidohydrolase family protein [Actinomycetia bacterium]|nr:amidohydrolase family protein [Actinomycetes bacterium]MCP5034089.1 amidohydrolase family protein [Actinomycetes bacterium]